MMANMTGPVADFDVTRERAVGRRLRDMRESADLTQRELADKLGITQAAISKYEQGLPPTRVLLAAADVCGWTMQGFFAGIEGQRPTPPPETSPADAGIASSALELADELRDLAARVTRRQPTPAGR